jgi:hypothetical protein
MPSRDRERRPQVWPNSFEGIRRASESRRGGEERAEAQEDQDEHGIRKAQRFSNPGGLDPSIEADGCVRPCRSSVQI